MKHLFLVMIVGVLVGCGKKDAPSIPKTDGNTTPLPSTQPKKEAGDPEPPKIIPNSPETEAAIEGVIRTFAQKYSGELTEEDYEKVTEFYGVRRISDVSPLINLTQLEKLDLNNNPITNVNLLAKLHGLKEIKLSYFQKIDV